MSETTIPKQIVAGDSIGWTKSLSNYPASAGWALSYTLVSPTARQVINGSASGDDFLLAANATTTAAWAPGTYTWTAAVSKGTDRYTIESGQVEILADPATAASGLDTRSHVKKTLDALEAVIEGKAANDQLAVSVAGRSITRMSPEELLSWRDKYNALYIREQVRAGNRPSRSRVLVRF